MQTIADGDAIKQFARLLDAAESGEEVTITRDGKPVARIVPVVDGGRTQEETEVEADLQTQWAARQQERIRTAADEIRTLGRGLRLDGLTIRDLISDGRR
jgi:prevent-host-death family protein